MNARTIRRAQERQAAKQARKAARQADQAAVLDHQSATVSEAQLAANRANAQLSTGPASDTGKAVSCLNAVKTGLTGRTVLLPTDDAAAYTQLIAAFVAKWQPVGDEERRLVQSLVDTEWRLMRIPSLEAGLYALGRLERSNESEEAGNSSLIEARIFVAYQRQLNNLSIQENRLRRQRDKDTAQLRALQHSREEAAKTATAAATAPENGFVFSDSNETAPVSLHRMLLTEPALLASAEPLASTSCPLGSTTV